ncbi:MAG: SLC13 family permease [Proteobacteria bacterium]|nr:SLC13 family permease [Pseudomonadota bacterium]
MISEQTLSFVILAATMVLFVMGRLRYDLVAFLSLLAAVATGVVTYENAFKGFADDIVIIVGSALVVSAGVARSGLPEYVLQRAAPHIKSPYAVVMFVVTSVAVLSAFVKNIGALALMIPIALRMSRRVGPSPAQLLMPMSFAALIGGLTTLIGTSPNIIVSRFRVETTGQPFSLFDFAPVGAAIAFLGAVYLFVAFRLLPESRKPAATLDEVLDRQDYATEAFLPDGSPIMGEPLSKLIANLGDDVTINAAFRKEAHIAPLPDLAIEPGDVFILVGKPAALQAAIKRAGLRVEGEHRDMPQTATGENPRSIEAIVDPSSPLVGQSAGRMRLHARYDINLLAVSRNDRSFTERLRDIVLQEGDVLVIQGDPAELPERLRDLGCLPLAERAVPLGSVPNMLAPIGILLATMAAAAAGVVPVAIAFFAGAVAMVLFKALTPREAYAAVDWPILMMLGGLIPLSEAIQNNGGAEQIADFLAASAKGLPPSSIIALMMVTAMAATPFLNNAATVLVLAPIAVSFAQDLGYNPDAFLMAVAIGAACDFLTPTGHQCNTMVLRAGGYKFGDYARLGAPLTLLVLLAGVPLILFFWPL